MFAPDLVGYLSLAGFGFLTLETLGQFSNYLTSLKSQFASFRTQPSSSRLPRTKIILCLRGTDPYLDQCIHRLANQNHPDYRLTIVLDSDRDEALPVVERMLEKYGEDRIEVLFRKYLLPTCSRRANSFLTALESIDEDVEAVVLCDGDAVVHQNWLRELTAQLTDDCPAVSGNRWYSPENRIWAVWSATSGMHLLSLACIRMAFSGLAAWRLVVGCCEIPHCCR